MAVSPMGCVGEAYFKAPLLNNPHFQVALMADPGYADQFAQRYERLADTLPPLVVERADQLFPGSKVEAVNFVGSGSVFRDYPTLDVNVILAGCQPMEEMARFKFTDENGDRIDTVNLRYIDINGIDAMDYGLFMYAKPVIYGSIPDLHGADLPYLMYDYVFSSLKRFDHKLKEGEARRANHALMTAGIRLFTLHGLKGLEMPDTFTADMTAVAQMELSHKYNGSMQMDIKRRLWTSWQGLPIDQ